MKVPGSQGLIEAATSHIPMSFPRPELSQVATGRRTKGESVAAHPSGCSTGLHLNVSLARDKIIASLSSITS